MEKYIYSKQLLKQKSMSLGGNSIGASFDNGLRGRLPRDCASDLNESFQDGVLFNLRAVIVHSGGIHSGKQNCNFIYMGEGWQLYSFKPTLPL